MLQPVAHCICRQTANVCLTTAPTNTHTAEPVFHQGHIQLSQYYVVSCVSDNCNVQRSTVPDSRLRPELRYETGAVTVLQTAAPQDDVCTCTVTRHAMTQPSFS